jgi:hypothetical protein
MVFSLFMNFVAQALYLLMLIVCLQTENNTAILWSSGRRAAEAAGASPNTQGGNSSVLEELPLYV